MSFLIPLIFAMSKFGEYPSYHTVGAKVAAVLLAPSYYILILVTGLLFLKSINFKEGNTVKKGQLLYTVDQQPFLANVGTQKGLLAEKKTQLVLEHCPP